MNAVLDMLATGWPLMLVGFGLGLVTQSLITRKSQDEASDGDAFAAETSETLVTETPVIELAPGEDGFAALEVELKKARKLISSDAQDIQETKEALKTLDEAIKRANGRLKLLTKAVRRGA